MQDSPAMQKNYTLTFNIQKEIATFKLNNYIATASFSKGYLGYPKNTYLVVPVSYVAMIVYR